MKTRVISPESHFTQLHELNILFTILISWHQSTMSPIKPSTILPTRAPGPLQAFIDGYPHQRTSPGQNYNLEFYTLARKCQPDNLDLQQMRAKLSGDMDECEYNHGWVQWRVHRSFVSYNPLMNNTLSRSTGCIPSEHKASTLLLNLFNPTRSPSS